MQVEIIILIYFIGILFIGIRSYFRIKTPADYYVAGKKAGFLPVSGSLLATILGGSAILGTIELSQNIGWAALWFLFSAAAGLFVLVPLSRKVKRYGNFTLPELLGKFYGKNTELIASVIIPVAWLGIVAAQIIAAAQIISGLGIVSYSMGAVIAGTVFIVYTLVGGQHSILKTDGLQSVLILLGLIAILFFALFKPLPESFETFQVNKLFNSSFTIFDLFILLLTYSVTFVVGPDIYSRLFCAKDERTASKSVFLVAVILIPVSIILTFIGIYSVQTENTGIVSFAENLLPGWIYGLFIAALLSTVMSSADTTLLTSSIILSELITGNLSKLSSMHLTRIFVILLGVLSILIALYITSIIQALLFALTFYSGAFTIPTLLGLLKIKLNKQRIVPAIIVGGIIALSGKIINANTSETLGNLIIISSFIISLIILFIPLKKRFVTF